LVVGLGMVLTGASYLSDRRRVRVVLQPTA
jgi:hypothetical protein